MEIQTKKYTDIKTLTQTKKLNQYDFANLFNVVQLGEKSYFNICKTINFENVDDIAPNLYYIYTITDADSWTGISYKFYETIRLWWLICKFNSVVDPFKELTPRKINKSADKRFSKTNIKYNFNTIKYGRYKYTGF